MTIFKSIRNFFTGNKSTYEYDSEMTYASRALIAFNEKFHNWGWTYVRWKVDLEGDKKYTMEFIDNLGNHNIFSDSSIVGLNCQFNVHSRLVISQPYKQTSRIKRFGKVKG
jgi:hypothetical protein